MIAARRAPAVHPTWLFLAGATAIYAGGTSILRHLGELAEPRWAAISVAFDLTFTLTFFAWLFPVRKGVWPAKALLPVFLLALALARRVVPAEGDDFFGALQWFVAPLEVALFAWIGVRAWGAMRRPRPAAAGSDRLVRLREAARGVFWSRAVADALAFELAVLAYAFGPSRRAEVPATASAFSYNRRIPYGPVVAALGLVIVAETVPVHLLISRWRPDVAWLLTALGLYTLVYLLADWRAAYARPILLLEDELLLRIGLRWTVRISLRLVTGIERRAPRGSDKPLRAALFGGANLWLSLSEPVVAEGPYGRRRGVSSVALAVDEPERLVAEIRASG